MKKSSIISCILGMISIIAAVGSQTFLSACRHEDGSLGSCQMAGRVLTCIAVLTAVISLISLFWKSSQAKAALYICEAAAGVMAIVIPGHVIPLCMMSTMRCRALMQPSMLILFGILIAVSVLGTVLELAGSRGK